MSKTELVPTYLPHQSYSEKPAFYSRRDEARELKRQGKGYFHFGGRVFRLVEARPEDLEEIARRHGFRDESACIQVPTMIGYVIGERRAVAAVNSWAGRVKNFAGELAAREAKRNVSSPWLAAEIDRQSEGRGSARAFTS